MGTLDFKYKELEKCIEHKQFSAVGCVLCEIIRYTYIDSNDDLNDKRIERVIEAMEGELG